MSRRADLASRRALLVTRGELERLEIALAWSDVRRALRPDPDADARRHPWLGKAFGLAIPLLGATRARRFSRYLSLGLLAYRVATGLRRPRS